MPATRAGSVAPAPAHQAAPAPAAATRAPAGALRPPLVAGAIAQAPPPQRQPRQADAVGAPVLAADHTTPRPIPLKDPLPKVDSILIDQDRRLAIVEGAIVTVGDIVGLRVVTQIERDGVLFREPSGLIVRVALRFNTTAG